MSVFVSRQRYYDPNMLCVELANGGSKYSGKDTLTAKFAGEGKNLLSPVDAVNVAIRILSEWDLTYFDEKKYIVIVNIDGKGGSQVYDPHNKTHMQRLEEWGKRELNKMPKCGNCQRPIGNVDKAYEIGELPKQIYCSEACMAYSYRHFFNKEPPRTVSNRDKKSTP